MVKIKKGVWTHGREGSLPHSKNGKWDLYKKENRQKRIGLIEI